MDQLKLPDNWQARSHIALADGAERINDHSDIWRDLKPFLMEISHNKCFYCEMVQERSDGAVDHFRPKSKYPWSAFRHSNYRFACTFCNSVRTDRENGKTGGKGDNFPLVDEAQRATCLDTEQNENPILLDPCEPDEPGLIDFDQSGRPIPRYSEEVHAGRYRRANESIKFYHLGHSDLVDTRTILAVSIERKVKAAERLFPLTESGNVVIDNSFKEHVRTLANCISENAELSVFARRILAGHRHIEWVDSLLCSA
tara:strand:+ start:5933 stop:6700 length:768 start_codon:yes stop_codon:yes gene_type:complete